MNLERRKIMGIESQCMILAAEDKKDRIVLIKPENEIDLGSRIR
jgi:tRNA-binding EMAP/Myf-like protein